MNIETSRNMLKKFIWKKLGWIIITSIYYVSAFILPINGHNVVDFIIDAFEGDVLWSQFYNCVYVLLMLFSLLMVYTTQKGIWSFVFSKNKYAANAGKGQNQYEKISKTHAACVLAYFPNNIFIGWLLLSTDAEYLVDVIYLAVGGILLFASLITYVRFSKKNPIERNLVEQDAKKFDNMRGDMLKENKTDSADIINKDRVNNLIEYKKLLDDGIISQEEFDKKKQELLK